MRERLPRTLRVCSSGEGHQQHAAQKKVKKDSGAAENVSWTDDEVEQERTVEQ